MKASSCSAENAGTREHGIGRFADAFAAAGFVVQLHDHRTFGVSGEEPRQDVDPWRQIADWRRRAIFYLERRPEVDAGRIGIWGSSYAGGHSLVLGATDRRGLSNVDWESHDGHYRVQIDGEWVDVPEDAVVTEPNRAGRTIVWPFWLDGHPQVICFMPGSMT